jgi:TonB-dependent receptor
MRKMSNSRAPLAAAVALALGTSAMTPMAIAQVDDDEVEVAVLEEVMVTGIRSSLRASMDIKRASSGVVDAITAEDIGNFPDTNLAESLQRITGVSIDRDRGEGSRVTVRGFGPEFNLVLLNGRQMPTSGVGGAFGNGLSRSFDFGNLASEGVSAVEVYKTGQADVPTGGIGATLNIMTTRPLDGDDTVFTLAAAAMNDKSSIGDSSFTPEFSGLWSQKFADDTFGISVAASYQERESGAATASVSGWRSFPANTDNCWCGAGPSEWGGIPPEGDPNQVNRPTLPGIYSVPQTTSYSLDTYKRDRLNGQLTMQWQPTESIRATLDYTYAEMELERTYNSFGAWYNFGAQDTVWTDGPNASPLAYGERLTGSDFGTNAGRDGFKNENHLAGFNLTWDATESLMFEFDYHNSSAESGSNSPYGTSSNLAVNTYTRDRTITYFGNELPILSIGFSEPLAADQMTAAGSVFANEAQKMEVEQGLLGGQWFPDFEVIDSIDFGVQATQIDNRAVSAVVQRDAWSAQTPLGALSDLMTPANLGGAFSEFAGSNDPRMQTEYFVWNLDEVVERFEELMASGQAPVATPSSGDFGPCGTGLCASENWTSDRRTSEETISAYLQANLSGEMGSLPWGLRAGVRYEDTDVTSSALSPIYTGLNWNSGNEIALVSDGGQDFTTFKGSYDYWLPNIDFNLDLTETIVARASYSKTLARPDYVSIEGGQSLNSPVRIDGGTGSRGNPALLPYISDNIDITFEWYYGDASYLSVGYFHKEVDNFIGRSSIRETPFMLPHPGLGPLADEARAATGSSESSALWAWILANRPDAEGVDAANSSIVGVAGRDPAAPFNISVPVNFATNELSGWEFNIQHVFGDSGFGVIANYTYVDSPDAEYDDLSLGLQFPLTGLSDSANFVAYWENEKIGIRFAYNWRERFLAGTGQDNVGVGPPTYVNDYQQIDMNANWWVTDNWQVFVDVLNLTNETRHVYGRTESQTLFATQQGLRYNIGFRYKF